MSVRSVVYAATESDPLSSSFHDQMRAFLDGESHGEELFHALYDPILEEPIPERLRALLPAGKARR